MQKCNFLRPNKTKPQYQVARRCQRAHYRSPRDRTVQPFWLTLGRSTAAREIRYIRRYRDQFIGAIEIPHRLHRRARPAIAEDTQNARHRRLDNPLPVI